MNIRAKFDGGKQYNRSQRGSWDGRCAGAGLQQIIGPDWGPIIWEKSTGKEANPVFSATSKARVREVGNDRKWKSSQAVKEKRLATKINTKKLMMNLYKLARIMLDMMMVLEYKKSTKICQKTSFRE